MKTMNLRKTINLKNIIVLIIVAIVHFVALFASPFFLGTNYSKMILIDDYCSNNKNGESLILSSNLSSELCSYENIKEFKNKYDEDLNTIAGIAALNANLDGDSCSVVGAIKGGSSNFYNKYRIYSEKGWNNLNSESYIYIPETMISKFASTANEVINKEADILINGVPYHFKIGGYYSVLPANSGWWSRGNYFDNYFDTCIFVSENFLADKYDCVFEMFTHDSNESGNVYDNFTGLIKKHGGKILQPKNIKEIELLNRLAILNKTTRNKTIQIVLIVVSLLTLFIALIFSVMLFNVKNISVKYRLVSLFVWSVIYYASSCIFVLISRNRIINVLGFSAYGNNKALLNILLIFLVLMFVAISIKTIISWKKDQIKLSKKINKTQSILFVTKAKFPNDNAFATYISGIASVYKKAGYDVSCIGNGNTEYGAFVDSNFGQFVSMRKSGSSLISRVISHLFYEHRVYRLIKNNFDSPTHIFFSCEFSTEFYNKIKTYYSDKEVGYSFILTEEYTKDEFEKYNFIAKNSLRINRYFVNKYFDKEDSFIVISKYLLKKIHNRQMKCIYVPFSFDFDYVSSIKRKSLKHKGINYLYCGSPENKDLLPTIINTFSNLNIDTLKNDIHLDIVGVDEEWAANHGITSYNKDIITFYGRKNIDFIAEKYRESDYSVLLRDEEKTFAKAGFPTKISESMAFEIVPITNLSSNLSDYLNNDNSIIVKGHKDEDLAESIKISINEFDKVSTRKENAFQTAYKYFNVETHNSDLISLINNK